MKRITVLLLMFLCLVSCNSITDEIEIIENNKEYVVSIGVAGEILDVTQVPLSKASGDDLYGIQVYARKTTNDSYTHYAYGLFDDISDLKITLKDGYMYKFVSTCVIKGKDDIYHSQGENDVYMHYGLPFRGYLNNTFIYSDSKYLSFLESGDANLNNKYGIDYSHPTIDRYYGEVQDFEPAGKENVTIEMLRMVFGAKLIVQPFKEGTLKVSLNVFNSNVATSFVVQPSTETQILLEEIFSYGDYVTSSLSTIWRFEKISYIGYTFSHSFDLKIVHIHSDGKVEETVYNKSLSFPRCKMTTVSFKLNESEVDTGNELSSKVNVVLEDKEVEVGETIEIN